MTEEAVRPTDEELMLEARIAARNWREAMGNEEYPPNLTLALDLADALVTKNRNDWASRMMELASLEQNLANTKADLDDALKRAEGLEFMVRQTKKALSQVPNVKGRTQRKEALKAILWMKSWII